MQASLPRFWLAALVATALALASAPAAAVTTGPADVWPAADCSAHADLNVTWTGAGSTHFEFGNATDASGATIGTFGPLSADNDSYSGRYEIRITTAQRPDSLIGSYGWVGANPPSASNAVEFFVLYNCTTRRVLYRCSGPFGACPNNARSILAILTRALTVPRPIPTLSTVATVVLALGLAVLAGLVLGRSPALRRRRE